MKQYYFHNLLYLLAFILLLCGCSKITVYLNESSSTEMLLTTKSSEQQAVYNVQPECWLTPYIDAYELSTIISRIDAS